jgi:two-component system, NarL family, nitrate/nitrite response regulator NarL
MRISAAARPGEGQAGARKAPGGAVADVSDDGREISARLRSEPFTRGGGRADVACPRRRPGIPSTGGMNRVVVVDDLAIFAEALEVTLRIEGYEVDRVDLNDRRMRTPQLVRRIRGLRPSVALLGLDLGRGGDATDLVRPLTRAGVAVVIVTPSADRLQWGECLRYGARAVLPKTADLESLRATLRLICEGSPLPGRHEREQLVAEPLHERAGRQELRARLDRLSSREREVLGHLMAGWRVREIARVSYVSEGTVRKQVKSILARLGVSSQLAAVSLAYQTDWKPPSRSTPDFIEMRHAVSHDREQMTHGVSS